MDNEFSKKTVELGYGGIILKTPIGDLDIRFYEKSIEGDKDVLKILNLDKHIAILPSAKNKILIYSYGDREVLSVEK